MARREAWLKIDRRIHEHPKVRRIAKRLELPRFAVVGCLVYLWGIADDLGECLGAGFEEVDHDLPEGFLAAMEEVGWAENTPDGWLLRTRPESPRSARMRELANLRYEAEATRLSKIGLGEAPSARANGTARTAGGTHRSAASGAARQSAYAREREREKERERERTPSAVSPPPPAPDGAAEASTFKASAAMAAGLNGAAG